MHSKYELNTSLARKFSFFKKDDYEDIMKNVKYVKLRIAIFASLVVLFQFVSITQYDKDSVSFQKKSLAVLPVSEAATASLNKLSKTDLESFLLENLNKKSLSYKDMDELIKTAKSNKKEIPVYVYSHIVEKLKSNNEDIYKSETRLLTQSIEKINRTSLVKSLVNSEHHKKNIDAYNKLKYSISKKYELTEQKIAEIAKK